ncbi:MAG TPA: T9SS type A sorting domain-containing protein [Puia sp.]|nr:T9SS type A sorting domain-containing protein [Puia sp.]
MKKFYILFAVLYFAGLVSVRAQDTTVCNPRFVFNVNQHTVTFQAVDMHHGVIHSWSFGDGFFQTDYSSSANHSYAGAGYYTVKHMIRDSAGGTCRDSSIQYVYIDSVPQCQIFLALHADSSHLPNHYIFWAGPHSAGDSISWTVNDSVVVRKDTSFTHDFGVGYYTVCAWLHTSSGCVASSCYSFRVHGADSSDTTHTPPPPPPPHDTCSISFTYTVNVNEVHFTAHDSAGVDSLTWFIIRGADTAVLHGHTPVYVFSDTACYLVFLQAVDPRGCYSWSDQRVCIDSLPGSNFIASYPNPAPAESRIDLKLDQENPIYINIFNSMGHLVLSKRVTGITGMNHIVLPTADLPKGVYYVQIQYGNVSKRSKIQKL